jgi:pilus assembly protein FimV
MQTGSRGLARLNAVAAAALLTVGLGQPLDANALALGRVVVQSVLGEPLRAEIDVPDITADEAASLRVNLASSEAYRAAGIDVNPVLNALSVTLQRRPDGRAYLRLTGTRPVNEPFVDLIVEANWSSGRLVRDYTLLFDPPALKATKPAPQPVAPAVSAAPAPAASAPRAAAPAPAAPVAQRPTTPSAVATPPAPVALAPKASSSGTQVKVKSGDTASGLAMRHAPASVSLDQMLVAMLRANPNAFVGGNVNRLRSGAVIDIPSASEAASIDASEARQTIAAQSRDFDEFRRRLAGAAPAAAVGSADRSTSGRVQTEVRDQRPAPPTADKLTLSKEAAPGKPAAEDKIAQQRQAKDTEQRVAELARNIEELGKLGAGSSPSAAPAAAPAAPSAPATAPAAPATAAAAPATAPEASATAAPAPQATLPTEPAAASAPVTSEPAPAPAPAPAPEASAAPKVATTAPQPAPDSEPSLLDDLLANPLLLPLGGVLAALLAGLGLYRVRQRKTTSSVDSSFLESRLQPDSFFGSSGGQRIDTAEATATGSSMVYSPSQLDAAGDVDPVAEADVYLAYGRDLQAEEILKEAMRTSPTRVAIHGKLLEIYAKRRDARAFEVVAAEAFGLTSGQGPEWDRACELGRDLDPNNPLYQPGGTPPAKSAAAAGGMAPEMVHTRPFEGSSLAALNPIASATPDIDLDLSLDELGSEPVQSGPVSRLDDLSSTEALTSSPRGVPPAPEAPTPAEAPEMTDLGLDLDFDIPATSASSPSSLGALPAEPTEAPALDLPSFDLNAASDAMDAAPAPAAEALNFDLNDLSLDLGAPAESTATANESPALTEENPLETKLSLAEEFRAIGDLEGARSLAEEVLAEATGSLKTKATAFLADLS